MRGIGHLNLNLVANKHEKGYLIVEYAKKKKKKPILQ